MERCEAWVDVCLFLYVNGRACPSGLRSETQDLVGKPAQVRTLQHAPITCCSREHQKVGFPCWIVLNVHVVNWNCKVGTVCFLFKNHGHKMSIWSFELQAEDVLGEPIPGWDAPHLVHIYQHEVHVHWRIVWFHGRHTNLAGLVKAGEKTKATHIVWRGNPWCWISGIHFLVE